MASIMESELLRAVKASHANGEPCWPPAEAPQYFRWKQIPARVLAAILLIPAIPFMLLLVALVRLTSPGPGIFRQVRVGRGGRIFTMYKIRTMRHDAEASTGPVWAQTHDPRLTRIGRFIRRLHMDELPQLVNVVKGEMVLVGPRPERPEFTQVLAKEVDGYLDRLAVRPGITGLAQINLPPDTDFDSVRRKLVLDLAYIREAGPGLDLRILVWTALRICGMKGFTTELLGVARCATLPGEARNSPPPTAECEAPQRNGDGEVAKATVVRVVDGSASGNGHVHNGSPSIKPARPVKPR